jgi:hypothetical protein
LKSIQSRGGRSIVVGPLDGAETVGREENLQGTGVEIAFWT